MSTYEPGTVAVATVRGVPNVRVFRRHNPETGVRDWAYNPEPERGLPYSCDSDASDVVTDVRPLVVLDLDTVPTTLTDAVGCNFPNWLRTAAKTDRDQESRRNDRPVLLEWIADQIEAQTKPPRIPEPGWGAIVEAGVDAHDERLLWTPNDQGFWSCKNPDEYARHWQQLVDPTLVRDGIEVAS